MICETNFEQKCIELRGDRIGPLNQCLSTSLQVDTSSWASDFNNGFSARRCSFSLQTLRCKGVGSAPSLVVFLFSRCHVGVAWLQALGRIAAMLRTGSDTMVVARLAFLIGLVVSVIPSMMTNRYHYVAFASRGLPCGAQYALTEMNC